MFLAPRRTHRRDSRIVRERPWERERRVIVRFLVIGAMVATFMTTGVLGSQRGGGTWVTVRSGQTLWGIAVHRYPNTDPRQAVYDIQAANHLTGAAIYPGERLLLPTE